MNKAVLPLLPDLHVRQTVIWSVLHIKVLIDIVLVAVFLVLYSQIRKVLIHHKNTVWCAVMKKGLIWIYDNSVGKYMYCIVNQHSDIFKWFDSQPQLLRVTLTNIIHYFVAYLKIKKKYSLFNYAEATPSWKFGSITPGGS